MPLNPWARRSGEASGERKEEAHRTEVGTQRRKRGQQRGDQSWVSAPGEPPQSKKKQKKQSGEEWGYADLPASWRAVRTKVPPADMLDYDLAQQMTAMRTAAPPSLDEEMEG